MLGRLINNSVVYSEGGVIKRVPTDHGARGLDMIVHFSIEDGKATQIVPVVIDHDSEALTFILLELYGRGYRDENPGVSFEQFIKDHDDLKGNYRIMLWVASVLCVLLVIWSILL